MALTSQQPTHEIRSASTVPPYHVLTHRPLVILLAIFPLIVIDELGILLLQSSAPENLAREKLRSLLVNLFDVPPLFALIAGGAVITAVLFIWHIVSNDPWRVRPLVLAGIPVEGAAWSLPLLVVAPLLTMAALAAGTTVESLAGLPLIDRLLVSTAAGLYEELIFRMAAIALLHTILVDLLKMKNVTGTVISILGSALLFAWYHDPALSAASTLIFSFIAGLYLGGIFVLRGFGVVVWTHVLYDVIVSLMIPAS